MLSATAYQEWDAAAERAPADDAVEHEHRQHAHQPTKREVLDGRNGLERDEGVEDDHAANRRRREGPEKRQRRSGEVELFKPAFRTEQAASHHEQRCSEQQQGRNLHDAPRKSERMALLGLGRGFRLGCHPLPFHAAAYAARLKAPCADGFSSRNVVALDRHGSCYSPLAADSPEWAATTERSARCWRAS